MATIEPGLKKSVFNKCLFKNSRMPWFKAHVGLVLSQVTSLTPFLFFTGVQLQNRENFCM